jgi:SAM-dependent methyltransferase
MLTRLRRSHRGSREPSADDRLESWLEHFHGERLAAIDAACVTGSGDGRYALFRELDDRLWALLLTQEYERYPHIKALLPDVPEPALQELWNGRSGVSLAGQSRAFYAALRGSYGRHGRTPLSDARVLDFGCGWGRLTRLLARDVAPGRLFGCDPVEGILDVCRANRVPATLRRSDFRPRDLPFEERFDLAFAFSVFTHLSEAAHEDCLEALHRSLAPDGLLILTVRPPAYLRHCEPLRPVLDDLGPDLEAALSEPRYLFRAHEPAPSHPQRRDDGQIDYGEAVIPMSYMRERWATRFSIAQVNALLDDPYQVMVTLRARP